MLLSKLLCTVVVLGQIVKLTILLWLTQGVLLGVVLLLGLEAILVGANTVSEHLALDDHRRKPKLDTTFQSHESLLTAMSSLKKKLLNK